MAWVASEYSRGKFLWARGRDVTFAQKEQAIGGDEVGEAVDEENSGDADVIVDEADEGAGEEHAALHADQHGGVGSGELAWRNDFLHQCVDVGPIHRGAGAGDQRH